MAKVRVHAEVVYNSKIGGYEVKRSDGIRSAPIFDKQQAQRHADYINNEDSDYPQYQYVKSQSEIECDRRIEAYRKIQSEKRAKREARSRAIADEKEMKAESNRQNRKADEKYVYVIRCSIRGWHRAETWYLTGETNLLKEFDTSNEKEAKAFKTKASAQAFLDKVFEVWMVQKCYRDFKVVRKPKALFEK